MELKCWLAVLIFAAAFAAPFLLAAALAFLRRRRLVRSATDMANFECDE